MRTAVLIDPRFREHDTGAGHPERPDRIAALERMLHEWRGPALERVDARDIADEELAAIHSDAHVARIRATAGVTGGHLDADTPTSPRSYEVARLAAGGVLALVDAVAEGSASNGFALVRPPGHHATPSHAMGFCLFNNVALAAAHLRRRHGLTRIAILDWDLHHGNGTQEAFWEDPGVLFASLHQFPFYPGTGSALEVGGGAGRGYTINVPFSAGAGDAAYQAAFQEVLEPILLQFSPEFVLVSAGFDAHRRDPLGQLEVTEAGYAAMIRSLLRVAATTAGGRIAAVLEGGYDLQAIARSAEVTLDALVHRSTDPLPALDAGEAFAPLKEVFRPFWTL